MKKEVYKESILESLAESADQTFFWNIINKYRFRGTNEDVIDLHSWQLYPQTLYPPRNLVLGLVEIPLSCNQVLDSAITSDEVYNCLKKCGPRKAPGPDCITSKFYSYLPQGWIQYLLGLFNRVLDEKKVPSSWSQILLEMIHKGRDKENPANYRPVAPVKTITKAFTSIV